MLLFKRFTGKFVQIKDLEVCCCNRKAPLALGLFYFDAVFIVVSGVKLIGIVHVLCFQQDRLFRNLTGSAVENI